MAEENKTLADLYKEMKKENPEQYAFDKAIDQLREISETTSPELKLKFAEMMRDIAELMTISQAQNISTEKSQSNISSIILLLKNMNALGNGENHPNVQEAAKKHEEFLKHPSGRTAIKDTFNQIDKIVEK